MLKLTQTHRRRVAVIGGGISGLGAAYRLAPNADVTLFEAQPRLGGHARTLMAGPDRNIAVDTGFMVFNDQNYPELNHLFDQLDIPKKPSNMSFAVSLDDGKFEYGLHHPKRMFADRRNLLRPSFYNLIRQILVWNKRAPLIGENDAITLGEFVRELGLTEDFLDRFLCPLAGAIWSTSTDDMRAFPAATLIQFFKNHGLLSALNNPTWYTVDGGSQVYVERLVNRLETMGTDIREAAPVRAVFRDHALVVVTLETGETFSFDDVIFACHSDQALKILNRPDGDEQRILGALRYRDNTVILHGDARHMPQRRRCWSSWVYKGRTDRGDQASFTYWMNLLQGLPQSTPLFVTLNPTREIAKADIYDVTTLAHPQFDLAALRAQKQLSTIQGRGRVWYAGAYTRYGFHEDGLASGLSTAQAVLDHASENYAVQAAE